MCTLCKKTCNEDQYHHWIKNGILIWPFQKIWRISSWTVLFWWYWNSLSFEVSLVLLFALIGSAAATAVVCPLVPLHCRYLAHRLVNYKCKSFIELTPGLSYAVSPNQTWLFSWKVSHSPLAPVVRLVRLKSSLSRLEQVVSIGHAW